MYLNKNKINKIVKESICKFLSEDEKLSNHNHSIRQKYDLRFHVDIYMPGGLKEMCYILYNKFKGQFKLSNKGKNKIGCDLAHSYDEKKLEKIANSIAIENSNLFEVLASYNENADSNGSHYTIRKFVVRVPYDSEKSISIVFSIENGPKIVTAWLNTVNDNHRSLNTNLYVASKKDRQERIKSFK